MFLPLKSDQPPGNTPVPTLKSVKLTPAVWQYWPSSAFVYFYPWFNRWPGTLITVGSFEVCDQF